ncbi:MAG TPA: hypothetical protein VM737_03705 [Gemmatimonadota bacterium]|nr:hypothetical protein [Gemmatimonadota bacterium]
MDRIARASGRIPILLTCASAVLACEGRPTVSGYWEGKGTTSDTPMKDDYRELSRRSEAEFWFVLGDDGTAVGEAEVVYDAELKVENLPSVSAGPVSFSPEVGGKVTDLDPRRRFPIVGIYDAGGSTLVLQAVVDSTVPKIEFTLRADPGVSGGMGGIGVGGTGRGQIVQKMPMTPWSPFGEAGTAVEKRPDGPYEARFEERGEMYVIQWSARQMGGEQREVEIGPEIERALRDLQRDLAAD